jgi:hypothetical protein
LSGEAKGQWDELPKVTVLYFFHISSSKVFSRETEHLLVGPVDFDLKMGRLLRYPAALWGQARFNYLGHAGDRNGYALRGVDPSLGISLVSLYPSRVDDEGHDLEGQPLDPLDAGQHDGPPSQDEGRGRVEDAGNDEGLVGTARLDGQTHGAGFYGLF